jgi:hypothetical protein
LKEQYNSSSARRAALTLDTRTLQDQRPQGDFDLICDERREDKSPTREQSHDVDQVRRRARCLRRAFSGYPVGCVHPVFVWAALLGRESRSISVFSSPPSLRCPDAPPRSKLYLPFPSVGSRRSACAGCRPAVAPREIVQFFDRRSLFDRPRALTLPPRDRFLADVHAVPLPES